MEAAARQAVEVSAEGLVVDTSQHRRRQRSVRHFRSIAQGLNLDS
jgi:hypothetical protein